MHIISSVNGSWMEASSVEKRQAGSGSDSSACGEERDIRFEPGPRGREKTRTSKDHSCGDASLEKNS